MVCVQPTVDKTKTIKIHPKYLSNDLVERKEKGKKTNKIYSFIKNNQKLLNISFIRICENDVQGNDANLYIVQKHRLTEGKLAFSVRSCLTSVCGVKKTIKDGSVIRSV